MDFVKKMIMAYLGVSVFEWFVVFPHAMITNSAVTVIFLSHTMTLSLTPFTNVLGSIRPCELPSTMNAIANEFALVYTFVTKLVSP